MDTQMNWLGHPVRDQEHARSLELKAAIGQFAQGMTREAAEHKAKKDDQRERHQQAAAHHLQGIDAARAIGNSEAAKKHHELYQLHAKAAGHDGSGSVAPEIERFKDPEAHKNQYTFRAHGDDALLGTAFGKSEYAKLRVVTIEDLQHVLVGYGVLAKADGAEGVQKSVKQFDASKSWLRHKTDPEKQAFDYSGFLTPEQHSAGYRLFVMSHSPNNAVRAHVVKDRQLVAAAHGNVDAGDLELERYHAHPQHGNKGLETSALNAMFSHAKSRMGANYLSHAPLTPEASAFVEAVAKPHGYELGEVEDVEHNAKFNKPQVKVASNQPRKHITHVPPHTGWWRTDSETED